MQRFIATLALLALPAAASATFQVRTAAENNTGGNAEVETVVNDSARDTVKDSDAEGIIQFNTFNLGGIEITLTNSTSKQGGVNSLTLSVTLINATGNAGLDFDFFTTDNFFPVGGFGPVTGGDIFADFSLTDVEDNGGSISHSLFYVDQQNRDFAGIALPADGATSSLGAIGTVPAAGTSTVVGDVQIINFGGFAVGGDGDSGNFESEIVDPYSLSIRVRGVLNSQLQFTATLTYPAGDEPPPGIVPVPAALVLALAGAPGLALAARARRRKLKA